MGYGLTNTTFHSTWRRSVRNPFWVQRNVTLLNIITRHEIAIYVIQNLITVYITVIIRCRNSFWMVIVQPWNERTNYESRSVKSLVHRWRLMNATCNRFEIMNAKSIRKIITVPTHNIKRMCRINYLMHHSLLFDFDQEIAFFVM